VRAPGGGLCGGRRGGVRSAALRSAGAATAGQAGAADFVLDTFDPEEEEDELSNENLLKILYSETTDQHVNDVVWRALGEHCAARPQPRELQAHAQALAARAHREHKTRKACTLHAPCGCMPVRVHARACVLHGRMCARM